MTSSEYAIVAHPTKDLFISMLIKDLSLADAISDLVDNSVDGARRMGRKTYKNLKIDIEAAADSFTIVDNCGGISIDNARNYAFRFGRPDNMPETPGSIGRFGIGMKRALFKLGGKFRVESTTSTTHFVVDVDVAEWKANQDVEWQFAFSQLDEKLPSVPPAKRGIRINVTELDRTVSQSFQNPLFLSRLGKNLELHHLFSIAKGLEIRINKQLLKRRTLSVMQSKELIPAYWKHRFSDGVTADVYSGIDNRNLDEGGWYIFCNGRLVLGPDHTLTTGWGDKEMTRIPKYHGQYDRFRGYVFFEAKDAALLPWNTTKTSVDVDAPKWKFVRAEMIKLMRPVCDFLNKIHQERQRDGNNLETTPLEELVEKAKRMELRAAKTASAFVAPKSLPQITPPKMSRIQYYKPTAEVNRAKRSLGVKTAIEVGEETFDYYILMELD